MGYNNLDSKEIVILADLEEALIGICQDIHYNNCAVYSTQKILDILVWRDRMEPAEAFEFFQFNIFTNLSSVGNPVFLKDLRDEEAFSTPNG